MLTDLIDLESEYLQYHWMFSNYSSNLLKNIWKYRKINRKQININSTS